MSKRKILHFPEIMHLLLLQRKRKFRIKFIDTIFFKCDDDQTSKIRSWYYTSNKGDLTQRKDVSNLNMLNVYDRFCRISGSSSTSCTRVIAVGYILDKDNSQLRRVALTLDQLYREAKSNTSDLLKNICWLQYNVGPCEGVLERKIRVVYSLELATSENGVKETRAEIDIHLTDEIDTIKLINRTFSDPEYYGSYESSLAQSKITRKELEASILKVVNHIEVSIQSICENGMDNMKVVQLTGDFLLDDKKQLWLSHMNRLVLDEDADIFHEILPEQDESSVPRTYLPAINAQEGTQQSNSLSPNHDSRQHHPLICDEEAYTSQIKGSICNLQKELVKAKTAHIDIQNKIRKILPEMKCSLERAQNSSQTAHSLVSKSNLKRAKSIDLDDSKASCIDCISVEKELRESNLTNYELQSVLTERRNHEHIIRGLEEECHNLRRQLEAERYNNDRSQKDLQDQNSDLLQEERRAKEELALLAAEIEDKETHHYSSIERLKGVNRVIEAEMLTQREYVHRIRNESYDDLASQLKVKMNDLIVQTISESCFGVSRAVASSDEIWKSKLTEISEQHSAEISRIHDEHRNEIRFKESQHRMELDTNRNELEERFQKRLSESLKAAVDLKERQRQMDVRNEIKRWEQVLSEANAQMSTEHQTDLDTKLQERDRFWETKLQEKFLDDKRILDDKISEFEEKIKKLSATHQDEIQTLLKYSQESQTEAVENAVRDVTSTYETMIKVRETELSKEFMAVESKIAKKMESDIVQRVDSAVRQEKLKVEKANAIIEQMAKEFEEKMLMSCSEMEDLKLRLQKKLEEKDTMILGLSNKLSEEKTNDKLQLAAEYEETLMELKKNHDMEICKIRIDANAAITKEVERVKAEADQALLQTIEELSEEQEEKMQSLDYEHGWLKTQLENANTELQKLQNALTKKDLDIQIMQEELNKSLLHHCYTCLYMNSKALIQIRRLQSMNENLKQEASEAQKLHHDKETKLHDKNNDLEKSRSLLEDRMKEISSTLLQFKREDILNHKVKSKEITKLINHISERIQVVDDKRGKAHVILENLEQAMHDVEKQLQDHTQTSALEKGKINLNHTRKKRRLDEEYEQILCKIESQREERNKIDEEFMRLKSEKYSATEEMRKVEKSLVELLVEQQKKLLSLSLR